MHSVDAHCFSCGYDTLLMIGSLLSSHDVYLAGPVCCGSCKAITTANYKGTELTCEVCKSSNVSPMRDSANWLGDDEHDVGVWVGLLLRTPGPRDNDHLDLPGHFKCPKCCEFELRFGTDYLEHGFRCVD